MISLTDAIALLILGTGLGLAIGRALAVSGWMKRYSTLQDQHLALYEKHFARIDENTELMRILEGIFKALER